MVDFTITIPNDKVDSVVDAFAVQYKYQDTITAPENAGEQIANPISKVLFAKNILKTFVKEVYVAAQVKELEVNRKAIIESATADVSGVEVA